MGTHCACQFATSTECFKWRKVGCMCKLSAVNGDGCRLHDVTPVMQNVHRKWAKEIQWNEVVVVKNTIWHWRFNSVTHMFSFFPLQYIFSAFLRPKLGKQYEASCVVSYYYYYYNAMCMMRWKIIAPFPVICFYLNAPANLSGSWFYI